MKNKKKYYRIIDQIHEDLLWPGSQILKGAINPEENIRYRAMSEVLRRIPDDDYRKLISRIDNFEWFIPHEALLGNLHPFFLGNEAVKDETGKTTLAANARVLYLSPILEKRAWDVVVAVVAHELAHLVIEHELITRDVDKQEKEAWDCVLKWGFGKEAKKHRASQKRKGFLVG